MTVTLTEEQRQGTLLALAHLSVERPGWKMFLAEIAASLQGSALYDDFRDWHQQAVKVRQASAS